MMKTRIIAALMAVLFGSASIASEAEKEATKAQSKLNTQILSPEQELMFASERLNEMVVKPIYTEVEQMIFYQQIKILKAPK